jgi:hypothetical protein
MKVSAGEGFGKLKSAAQQIIKINKNTSLY